MPTPRSEQRPSNAARPATQPPQRLEKAFADFRLCLTHALQAGGADPRSGVSVSSRFKLNRQLSWHLSTIASSQRVADGLAALPGTRGLQLVVEACRDRGGSAELAASLEQAVGELERAVDEHAGDRAGLQLLTAAWEPSEMEARTEGLRRDGYRAQCAMLGLQAASQTRGIIYGPSRSGDPAKVCMASYQVFNDVVRLRRHHDTRLLFVEAPTNDDGTLAMPDAEMETHMREKFALDSEHSTGMPADAAIVVDGKRGWVTLKAGEVGKAAASRWVFTGSARYEHPRFRSSENQTNQVGIVSLVPTERIAIDCLMDRRLAESEHLERSIRAACFDASTGLPMRPATNADPAYLFDLAKPVRLDKIELARDLDNPHMPEIVDRASARIGSSIDDLVGVRFQSRFAMSPSDFVLTRTLPERG